MKGVRAMNCVDRVAIVTGAAGKGMGRNIVLTLAREGASVLVNYRKSADSAKAIVKYIQNQGGRAEVFQADICEKEQCKALCDSALQSFGRIDICVVGPGGGWHTEPIEKLDSAAALNDARQELAPLYNLMPLVLPGMFSRKWGRFIGLSMSHSLPSPSYSYDSGKAARTHALLRAYNAAWPHGVTINIIAPGPVEELASFEDAIELCEHGPKWKERKNVTPQDIAEGVAMLCSDSGRFITGCVLPFMFYM